MPHPTPEFDPTMRWDVIASVPTPREYAYEVIVTSTGACCLSTNDLDEAITRARIVDGFVVERETSQYAYPRPATDEQIERSFDAHR